MCAVVGGVPATAFAADEAAGTWPMWLAAGIQVVIAITVGTVQSGQARIVRLNDERVAAVIATVDGLDRKHGQAREEAFKALSSRLDDLGQRLQTTREDYARRADMEASIRALSDELKEVRAEFKGDIRELRDDVKLVEVDLKKILSLLEPRS